MQGSDDERGAAQSVASQDADSQVASVNATVGSHDM